MTAGILPFGALPQFASLSPEEAARLAQQGRGPAAPSPVDGLLFDRAGLGGQGGFSGTSGTILPGGLAPRAMPTPPERPDDLSAEAPAAASARPLTFGQLPPRPAPAPSPSAPVVPVTTGSVAAAGAPPATAAPAAAREEPGFFDRLMGGIRDSDGLLGSIGIGLMSTPGWGQGAAAGLKLHQDGQAKRAATDLARAEYGLKQQKLAQQDAGNNATIAALVGKGVPLADAQAAIAASAAGHNEAIQNLLNGVYPKKEIPSGYTLDSSGRATPIPGGPQDLATIEAQAKVRDTKDDAQLVDVPLGGGQTQKQWIKKGEAAGTSVGLPSPPDKPQNFDTESKLRGEFVKGLGTFSDVHDGYGRVIAATKQRENNPNGVSPASDIGLVFGYMKMLDPGSVVREGEYATAANAAGIPERVRNVYNRAMSGEFLTPEQRQDFLGQAAELYGTARKTAEGVAGRYRNLAGQYGVDPDRTAYLPEMPVAPTVGWDRMKPGALGAGGPLDVGGSRDMGGGVTIRRTR